MKIIDLRSDTVTHPTPSMRKAMHDAEVGDDGFGDDPTVNKLQEYAAAMLGKEAGLFVASGTMGNLVCTLTHCTRAQEVILGGNSHMMRHERGGMAAIAGVLPRTIENEADGTLPLNLITQAINPIGHMLAPTRLICLENTWNGRVLSPQYTRCVREIADTNHLPMHLDGARIFNAAVALDKPVRELCSDFESVQFCFSKGLSAPIGSMICGSTEFINEARNNRHLVGGTMRQVGVIAAACLVALDEMVERLAEDHANAKRFAHGLAQVPGILIDAKSVETNIVFFGLKEGDGRKVAARLKDEGLLVVAFTEKDIRAVTHYGISREDIDSALVIVNRVIQGVRTA